MNIVVVKADWLHCNFFLSFWGIASSIIVWVLKVDKEFDICYWPVIAVKMGAQNGKIVVNEEQLKISVKKSGMAKESKQ